MLLVTLVTLLFVLTPIKQYLPGYESVSQNQDIYKIERKLYELEAEVNAREIYLESIRNALTNNVEYKTEKVEGEVAQVVKDTALNVQPSSADYQLRKAVETGQFAGKIDDEVKSNFTLSLRTIEQLFLFLQFKERPVQGFDLIKNIMA